MEKKSLKLVTIKDALTLVGKQVNLMGSVLVRKQPMRCRTGDWICTLRIIDNSYRRHGFTVNVFSKKLEELPQIKNNDDMILFKGIKIKSFDGGRGISGTCNKQGSSFALYERDSNEDFVCYQCTSNFHIETQYKKSLDEALKIAFRRIKGYIEPMYSSSFLREIKQGKCFDLICKILHVDEDTNTVLVWDGTDAPPTTINSDSINNTLYSRDRLLGFPTVGTILRVFLSRQLFRLVKRGEWVKIYKLLCEVDNGSWIGKVKDTTIVNLAQDDTFVEKIMKIYDKRVSSKLGHLPFWSFPSPPGLTETDADRVPFVTLSDIITFPKVTYKYKSIVRVLATTPLDERRGDRVLLTLEDPTATLEAFLCDEDAEYFWGLRNHNTEVLRKKWNQLLGIEETSTPMAPRNPPWIECCIVSYYTDKANPWKTRIYKIFGSRLALTE